MALGSQDFKITSGDDLDLKITILDVHAKAAVLSAPTAIWVACTDEDMSDASVALRKESAADEISLIVEGGFWKAIVHLLAADTENETPGRYYHALRVFDDGASCTTTSGIMILDGGNPLN